MSQTPHLEFTLEACGASRAEGAARTPQEAIQGTKPHEHIPRLTRLLALAHRWDRLITEGTVAGQAEIAKLMGLTPARVSQIMNLLNLSPDIQEKVLSCEVVHITERNVRQIACNPNWNCQRKIIRKNLKKGKAIPLRLLS